MSAYCCLFDACALIIIILIIRHLSWDEITSFSLNQYVSVDINYVLLSSKLKGFDTFEIIVETIRSCVKRREKTHESRSKSILSLSSDVRCRWWKTNIILNVYVLYFSVLISKSNWRIIVSIWVDKCSVCLLKREEEKRREELAKTEWRRCRHVDVDLRGWGHSLLSLL